MTRGSARRRDENKAETPLFHWRRRRTSSASIFYCILENDIPLLVNAMKGTQEKSPIFNSHKHFAKQKLPHSGYKA